MVYDHALVVKKTESFKPCMTDLKEQYLRVLFVCVCVGGGGFSQISLRVVATVGLISLIVKCCADIK